MRRGLQKVPGGLKSLREPGSCLYCRPPAHEYCPPKTHYVFPSPAGLELLEFSSWEGPIPAAPILRGFLSTCCLPDPSAACHHTGGKRGHA